ncbi:MAG: hypothetical protein FD155_764 [Bacteroidetes bacterium]|nr:MAG: hypothetical protein FD155_764 [Bacteroidota bacterium]
MHINQLGPKVFDYHHIGKYSTRELRGNKSIEVYLDR